MPGPGIAGVQARYRPVTASDLPTAAASSSSTPATVPYPVYAELCRECDDLHGYNQYLRELMSLESEGRPSTSEPAVAVRLRDLIRTATSQLEQMPPPTSSKYGQGRLFLQMMVDELQRIVDGM